ncbi:protein of unknown function [Shinella sp. WSC3-e]|nr:protein of unknown function [Shinella sp. WSC3-e]
MNFLIHLSCASLGGFCSVFVAKVQMYVANSTEMVGPEGGSGRIGVSLD